MFARDATRINSPSNVVTNASYAGATEHQRRVAIVWNAGCTSVGDWLITRRMSLVAVCCSSASVRARLRDPSSLKSRTFSIAITAWSAKVCSRAICFWGNVPSAADLR